MTIKQSAAFLVLMAAVTLAGAGCLGASKPTPTVPAESPAATAPAEEPAVAAVDDGCPEGSVRYATTTANPAFTFCHEAKTLGGESVVVSESNGVVGLSTGSNPGFAHSVRAFKIAPTDDVAAAIAERFMTEENRASCEIVTFEGVRGESYVIAGGDLETQEKCGEFRAGYFHSTPTDPFTLFYFEVGQDTFMPSALWIETIRPDVE